MWSFHESRFENGPIPKARGGRPSCPAEAWNMHHSHRPHQSTLTISLGDVLSSIDTHHSYLLMAGPPTIPQLLTKHATVHDHTKRLILGSQLHSVSSQPSSASGPALLVVMSVSPAERACFISLGPAPDYAPICSSILCRFHGRPAFVPNTEGPWQVKCRGGSRFYCACLPRPSL